LFKNRTEDYSIQNDLLSFKRNQMTVQRCDVLVIGGGPAGCTIAPLLAEKGYAVTLLEKAHHPRFHIGESLLPANLPLFEKLGVAEQVSAIGMKKYGAEFNSPWHDCSQAYEFADAIDSSMPMAYQVLRSAFDEILIKNAARLGVNVVQGCTAKQVSFLPEDNGVHVCADQDDGAQSNWQARYVVDASGRDTVLSSQLKLKVRNAKHNSVALYAHFSNAQRETGREGGNISIFWFAHGWFWYIPLVDGVTSVGMVTWPYFMKTRQGSSLEQFFMDGVAQCPALQQRLASATMKGSATATGNFSYTSRHSHGKNYMLLGDAFAFVDPIFSSGVWLAMHSGELGAEAVDAVLRNSQKAPQILKEFERTMVRGPKEFSWFIYRSSNPALRDMFMAPTDKFRMRAGLLSLLAGDIFSKTPIWNAVNMFKLSYYLISLSNFKRTWNARKTRQVIIRRDLSVESSVTST
jgi:flavin-dependent dehydrogenase